MIKCLFKRHAWIDIPIPTNPDYGKESPGIICVTCGKVILNISTVHIKKVTKEEKAKKLYDKYIQKEHDNWAAEQACICSSPPGPYDNPPKMRKPKND